LAHPLPEIVRYSRQAAREELRGIPSHKSPLAGFGRGATWRSVVLERRVARRYGNGKRTGT
jgi:hypothetical protein